ncbi:hypothetical protein JK358_22945 [Nocardia sp. 2]|uniref:Lipoprotein n=1 Tax=Nocardia acididurans TaxID=2802282 RepID=A0ABS1M9G6_9NOCA|nr:hypothetical protein [Nocardia acididurans]MBL1077262.1 hypothetical protein [Nocardia acididurans]
MPVVLVALAGCGPIDQPPKSVNVELGSVFTLAVGSTAHLDDGRISVLLREVSKDSRCPADVDCAWAGDAIVSLTMTVDPVVAERDLHITLDPQEADLEGYRVQLIDLEPGPREWEDDIAQSDYRASLRVSRING